MTDSTYHQVQTFSASLGGAEVRYASKPGIPDWEQVTPASVLLAEEAHPAPGANLLLLGGRHGALAVALARQAGSVVLLDTSAIAVAMTERTLQMNGIRNARVHRGVSLLPEAGGTFDMAVMELPKGRALIRRWLMEAYLALKPGGVLYLAGPNDEGIQPAIGDAEALFGLAAQIRYKRRNRVASALKQADPPIIPPWASEPGIAPGTWLEFEVTARGQHLRLRSLPGVFAYDRLDDGTALLLEHLNAPRGGRVLDVGCGSGAIGLLAARLGAARVDMLDSDLQAVAAARENIALNAIEGARALPSDLLGAVRGERYDLIVSNPPFHVGKGVEYDVAHALIADSRAALAEGGRLLVVANRFIRYDDEMRRHFAQVERLAETRQFHVLEARP